MDAPSTVEIELDKPKRLFTKRVTVLTLLWAMGLATLALVYRPEYYEATLTWMVPLILGVLGAYQGIGHADLRTKVQMLQPLTAKGEPPHDE